MGLLEQCQSRRDKRQSESSCALKARLERIRTQLDVSGKRGVRDDFKVFCLNSWKDGGPSRDKGQTTGASVCV